METEKKEKWKLKNYSNPMMIDVFTPPINEPENIDPQYRIALGPSDLPDQDLYYIVDYRGEKMENAVLISCGKTMKFDNNYYRYTINVPTESIIKES